MLVKPFLLLLSPVTDGKLKEDEKSIAMHRYVRDKQGKVTKTIYLNKDGKVVREE